MKLVSYALGKTDFAQFNKKDLVCVDKNLSEVLNIDYVGYPPSTDIQDSNVKYDIPLNQRYEQNDNETFLH
jgi:hypothetical protein